MSRLARGYRAGKEYLLVALVLMKSCRQGKQCLARSCLAGKRDELDIRIARSVEGKGLLGIRRVNAIGSFLSTLTSIFVTGL